MASSSTSWRPHHLLPRRGLHRAAASYHNAVSSAIDPVTRISGGDQREDGAGLGAPDQARGSASSRTTHPSSPALAAGYGASTNGSWPGTTCLGDAASFLSVS